MDAIGTPAAQDANTAGLFSPLQIRDVRFRNRIAVSPMCQYSAIDGVPDDWHLVHLGSRAIGGAALVIAEATGVEARGRISPGDLGLWNDEQQQSFARIAKFLKKYGAVPGIQIAHAGRKASTDVPWHNNGATLTPEQGGWTTVAPSAIPFRDRDPVLTSSHAKKSAVSFALSPARLLGRSTPGSKWSRSTRLTAISFTSSIRRCRTGAPMITGAHSRTARVLFERWLVP